MAKIPVGDFGFAVPQAQRTPTGSVENVGSSGAALASIGNAGMAIAENLQAQKDAEQKQADQERKRQIEEQRKADEALQRAKIGNAAVDRDLQTRTLAEDISNKIASGELHYNTALTEFDTQLQKLELPDLAGVDPVTRENFDKTVKRTDFSSRVLLERSVRAATVADYKTQADSLMDKLGKMAGLPGADVAQLNAQADGLDTLGRQAYGADWEKRKQDWRDRNWDAQVTQVVAQSRDNMKSLTELEKQLTSGDFMDKLDSERRNTQLARIAGFKSALIQKQEAASARAERESEHRMRTAEAEFNTFQSLADKGTVLDPTYIDRAVKATAGTPYQKGITALVKQAQETGGIARQPLQVQQATLDAIDREIAAKGRSPELDKRREQVAKVVDGSQKDVQENGLRAGVERGVIAAIPPIDLSNPATFSASVAERLKQSQIVSQWAGKTVSPLDSQEAEKLKTMLDALPAKQKSQAVATIATAVGPKAASAIAQQLDKQDRALGLSFSMAGSKTTQGRQTSELILKGATAIKDGVVMKDDKKITGWKATIASQIDGIYPNEQLSSATKEAAYLIAAGLAQENGGTIGNSDLERAVNLAVGGNIIERNGKKLPIPAGVDEDKLDKRLRSITPDEITRQAADGKVRVGGTEMTVSDFTKTIPGQELMYAGQGRYAVVVRGRPVTNSAGKPIIIGVQ